MTPLNTRLMPLYQIMQMRRLRSEMSPLSSRRPAHNGHDGFHRMLIAAFVILGIAVLLGSLLAVLHLRAAQPATPTAALGALHALVALTGFACLLAALRGPPRGLETGTTEFGAVAAVLLALAALLGGGCVALRLLKRRIASSLIGIHATLAVAGFVVLAAYLFAG
jgi:hypothetical protein